MKMNLTEMEQGAFNSAFPFPFGELVPPVRTWRLQCFVFAQISGISHQLSSSRGVGGHEPQDSTSVAVVSSCQFCRC